MAAISGALAASLFSFAVGSEFASFSSLTLLALIAIIPIGAPWFALMAGAGLEVFPAYINLSKINDYFSILFGVSAMHRPVDPGPPPGRPPGRTPPVSAHRRGLAPPPAGPSRPG